MNLAILALALVGVIETAAFWFVVRGLRRLDRMESRLGHLTDALALLTETAESGFRSTAVEISRIAERNALTAAGMPGGATRRIAAAAKKGRAASDIAVEEQMAEGEVNLRLHLAKSAAARRLKTHSLKETSHAALRA